ncbi:phosphodiesterase [bacterium]|nr:phosphodiesterase [bacterium]
MHIIAHRGYWETEKEKNSKTAFERAVEYGFGIETDLRDISGKIVISHNMPQGDEMTFEEFLQLIRGSNILLALNIKADGQGEEIKKLLKKYNHKNYFTFDMSIPDMVCQLALKLNVFTGYSDIITNPVLLNQAKGVWLDSFNSDWFCEKEINSLLNKNKQVCIVSPELHNREYKEIWNRYKNINNPNLMLCTDNPMGAKEFFND